MREANPVDEVCGWLVAPRKDTGVHMATDDGGWDFVSYPELAVQVRRVAQLLVEQGVTAGDTVCVLMPTSHLCLATIFAVLAAGATVTPVASPLLQPPDQYLRQLRGVLECSQARMIVTTAGFAELVGRAVTDLPRRPDLYVIDEVPAGAALDALIAPSPIALLQMTSGSTNAPRGVCISWRALAANLAAIDTTFHGTPDAQMASWLPLHHDMGLTGVVFQSISRQRGLYLMRPDQFVRDPARWLRAAAVAGHTASPSFGLGFTGSRLTPADLDGIDLSTLGTVVIGAEPINPSHLRSFLELTVGHGFSSSAFMPAYGLAEHTLIAAARRPGEQHRMVRIDKTALQHGHPVRVLAHETGCGTAESGSEWLMSVGTPMPGHAIRIVDQSAVDVPDGALGEIVLSGPSLFSGYRSAEVGASRWVDDELHTGDAGFVLDGQLYVLGRMGTSLKVNGRTIFAEDLDATVAGALGVATNRVVTVAVNDGVRPCLAMFIEGSSGDTAGARTVLQSQVGVDATVWFVGVPRGGLLRTSSGKPCRARMWQQWRAGGLVGAELLSVAGPEYSPVLLHTVRTLFDKARELAVIPDGATVHFEGSLAEGFGNQGSDIDFLLLVPGADVAAVMPTVLFIDGRRVEIRVQSHDQVRRRLGCIRKALDTGSLGGITEDALNRVQRFLRGLVLHSGSQYSELRDIVSYEELTGLMSRWWLSRATECLRQSAALVLLGSVDEAASWAREGLLQTMKAFLAQRGESYVEIKWLPLQIARLRERVGEDTRALLDSYQSLDTAIGRDYVERALALAAQLGAPTTTLDPGNVSLRRMPGVTTWPIRSTTHVVRDKADLFVLSPECAASWRQVVFGETLAQSPAAREHLHLFVRHGLVALAWQGGAVIKPAAAMCEPNRAMTPPPSTARPVVTVEGAPVDGAIARSPLGAKAFAECAGALVLANMVLQNAREDFDGAVKDGQWQVASLCGRRIVTMAVRILASAWGVTPLPADQMLLHCLDTVMPGHLDVAERARGLAGLTIDDQTRALAACDELNDFVAQVQSLTGGQMFPSSFDSREQWRETLRYGYQWLRMGGYLDAYVELDEARDLLASGGAQPAARGHS